VVAILFTRISPIGIAIGIAIGLSFVVWRDVQNAVTVIHHGEDVMARARRDVSFVHKAPAAGSACGDPGRQDGAD